jgi:hypothetical protein
MGGFYSGLGAGSQKPEARSQKPEARSQKPEARSQKQEEDAPVHLVYFWLLTIEGSPSGFLLLTSFSQPFRLLASAPAYRL